MAANPMPVLFFMTTVYIFQAMLLSLGEVEVDFPEFQASTGGGFFKTIFENVAETFGFIGEIIIFLTQFITFQPTGLPWYIGVPFAVGTIGYIIWSFATYVRGN